METCEVAFLFLLLCCSLVLVLRRKRRLLPPGPPAFPIVGNLLWLTRLVSDIELALRELRDKYGPIVTLHVGSRPTIMVTDRVLAHKLLVQHGAVFANRPTPSALIRLLSSDQHSINSAGYGPLWRLLRRNLMSEILHPSRVKIYAQGPEWVIGILLDKLRAHADSGDGTVAVVESFQYAMFCLLVLMCFGEKLDEKAVGDIGKAQRDLIMFVGTLDVFAFMPKFAKYVFRGRWRRVLAMRQRQREIYVPLIRARREQMAAGRGPSENSFNFSYVDSLLDLELPEENRRKLDDQEIISLCSEFLNAGTGPTSTALQWIMANVVKHQDVQERIVDEINAVLGEGDREIREEDLHKLTYLKAVVMEGLRRHPPGHFLLPHAVTEEFSQPGADAGYVEWGPRTPLNFLNLSFDHRILVPAGRLRDTQGRNHQLPGGGDQLGREDVGGPHGVPAREVPAGRRRGGGGHYGEQGDQDDAFRGGEEDMPRAGAGHAPSRVLRGQPGEGVPVEAGGRGRGRPDGEARDLDSDEGSAACTHHPS